MMYYVRSVIIFLSQWITKKIYENINKSKNNLQVKVHALKLSVLLELKIHTLEHFVDQQLL